MKTFIFGIDTRGHKKFEVKAESKEEACKLLADCGHEKEYLVESEDDWKLDDWSGDPIEKQLINYIEDEWGDE